METLKQNKKTVLRCCLLIFIMLIVFIANLISNKYIDKSEVEDYEYLKKYDCNQFVPIYITEEDMVKKYLNEYKNNMLFDVNEAWNSLNKDYRELKFGNIDKYVLYVNNFITLSTYSMEVDKYSVSSVGGKKLFNVFDKSGNQYLIKENSIMNYEIYLDEMTVNIS